MKFLPANYVVALLVCVVASAWHSVQTVGEDNRLSLRERETSGMYGSPSPPPITAVAIDEGNSWVIEGSQAGLSVRSGRDLSMVRVLPTQLEHIHDIALSPDRTMLAVAGGTPAESGAVELYRWPAGELWKQLEPQEDLIYSVAWRNDSKMFAAASADKTVKTYLLENAQCAQVLEGHSRPVLAVEFLPDDLGMVTAGVDESLRLWESSSTAAAPAVLKRTFTNHTRQVVDLALRPAHHDVPPVIASIGEDATVRLWQPTIGRMMRFAKLSSPAQAVCWTHDGQSLGVACTDGKVRIINPDTVEVTAELEAVQGTAYCIAVDTSGMFVVGGAGGQLKRLSNH